MRHLGVTRRPLIASLGILPLPRRGQLRAKVASVLHRSIPTIYQIAADDAALYATSTEMLANSSVLWKIVHGGATPDELTHERGIMRAITPHGSDVWFISEDRVMRIAKSGGKSVTMAQHTQPFFDMVCDGSSAWLSVSDTRRTFAGAAPPPRPGTISRMPLSGGPLVQVAEHHSGMPHLAVDDTSVYLATDDGIAAVGKQTMALQSLLATGDPNERPITLANGGDFLYALVRGELRQIDKRTGGSTVLYRAAILLDVACHDGWLYVVRNTAFVGPDRPPEPGGLIAISQANHAVRVLAEPLNSPQHVAIGGHAVFVLEREAPAGDDGLAQIKHYAALARD